MILTRICRHLGYRWNWLRNRLRVFGLRISGIQVGKNVYIGRWVEFHMSEGARLSIGDNAFIGDYAAFFVGHSASLSIGEGTFIGRFCEIASNANSTIG